MITRVAFSEDVARADRRGQGAPAPAPVPVPVPVAGRGIVLTVGVGDQRLRLPLDLGDEILDRVVLPRTEHDRDELRGSRRPVSSARQLPEPRRHPRTQQRALADTALRVQQRQARRAQVRQDDLPFRHPAEEPPGVSLRVEPEALEGTAVFGRVGSCGRAEAWVGHGQ